MADGGPGRIKERVNKAKEHTKSAPCAGGGSRARLSSNC